MDGHVRPSLPSVNPQIVIPSPAAHKTEDRAIDEKLGVTHDG